MRMEAGPLLAKLTLWNLEVSVIPRQNNTTLWLFLLKIKVQSKVENLWTCKSICDHSVCCLLSTNLKTLSTHETISNYELHYVLIAWKSLKYHRAWFLRLDLFNSIYLFSQNHVNVISMTYMYIYTNSLDELSSLILHMETRSHKFS